MTVIAHGRVTETRTGAGVRPDASQRRPRGLAPMAVLSVLLGGGAAWYGFLDGGESHPALKLGGAMAIAGAGIAVLALGRPADAPLVAGRRHSALVERHPLTLMVAWVSMGAALIHFAVARQHFDEYSLYGWFFVVVASAELAWAVLVVVTRSPALLVAGAVGNLAVVATWVVTRTYGSLVGPDANKVAKLGFGDLVSTAFEVLVVVGSIALVRRSRYRRAAASGRSEVFDLVVAIGVTLLTVLALYSAVGGHPFVSEVG